MTKRYGNFVIATKRISGSIYRVKTKFGKSGQTLYFNEKSRRWELYRGHNYRHYAVHMEETNK